MKQGAVGVVVYVEPKVSSALAIRCLEKVNDLPIIKYHLERLQAFFLDLGVQYFILHQNDVIKEHLTRMFFNSSVECFTSDTPQFLSGLEQLRKSHTSLTTLIIFPENAVFSDCDLTKRMLGFHLSNGADVTVAPEFPIGLVPVILQVDALAGLIKLKFGNRSYLNFLSTLQPSPDQELGVVSKQNIAYFGGKLSDDVILDKLPSQVLVTDRLTRTAAERTINQLGANLDFDSRAAYFFRQELLAIERDASADLFPSTVLSTTAPRILFCSVQRFFGGGEVSLFLLVSNLDRTRHQPLVVFRSQTVLAQKLEAVGIPLEIADYDFTAINPYNLRYCRELLRTYNIDLVHVDGIPNPALMTEAYYHQIPLVFHARNVAPLPSVVTLATKFIAISETVASNLRRRGIDPARITRIYNGVDLKLFNPTGYDKQQLRKNVGLDNDSFLICMVGRITADKRQETLIKALPKILSKVTNAKIIFVGEAYANDTSYLKSLRDLVNQLNLDQHVRFWGFEKDIASIYAMSDVLVLCSLQEGFGRCIIEAMAMGMPVIVPSSGGPVEIVRDQCDGILYDATNSDALAEALIRLRSDQDLWSRLKSKARERASSFDVTLHVEQVQKLYDVLLTGSRVHSARSQ